MHKHYVRNWGFWGGAFRSGETHLYYCAKHHKSLIFICLPWFKGFVPLLCENCSLQQSNAVLYLPLKSLWLGSFGEPFSTTCFWFGVVWGRVTLFSRMRGGRSPPSYLPPDQQVCGGTVQPLVRTNRGTCFLPFLLVAVVGPNRPPAIT